METSAAAKDFSPSKISADGARIQFLPCVRCRESVPALCRSGPGEQAVAVVLIREDSGMEGAFSPFPGQGGALAVYALAMQIVLFEPEIPPNTGNVARLCAATDTELHLIEPLGFSLEDRYLKRAGLDYWPHVRLRVWPDFAAYRQDAGRGRRLVMSSSRSGENIRYFRFTRDDALVFGPETRGLPPEILEASPHRVRIPIRSCVRSLNLSTAAGILLFQALLGSGAIEDLP